MQYALRDATAADVPAIAQLHVTTFNETHTHGRNNGPAFELRERQWQEILASRKHDWFCIVIEDAAGALVGFARGVRHDGGVPGFDGELNKIYVLRRCHRQGLGRRLVCQAAQMFLARGMNSMLLFGDANNPSNGFYEHLGAERLYSPSGEFHGGYDWRDLERLVKEACTSA